MRLARGEAVIRAAGLSSTRKQKTHATRGRAKNATYETLHWNTTPPASSSLELLFFYRPSTLHRIGHLHASSMRHGKCDS